MKVQNRKSLIGYWNIIGEFFDYGNLAPFAVVISVWHFVGALLIFNESLLVAIPTGILIDMLHYRMVRSWVVRRAWVTVTLAALTTILSYAFHLLYWATSVDASGVVVYDFSAIAFLLAAPLPLGIPVLAWQAAQNLAAKRERWQQAAADGKLAAERAQLRTDQAQAKAKEAQQAARVAQAEAKEAQQAAKAAQTNTGYKQREIRTLTKQVHDLQSRVREAQKIAAAWQGMNERTQLAAMVNAGLETKQKAIEITGLSKRTIEGDMARVNGQGDK